MSRGETGQHAQGGSETQKKMVTQKQREGHMLYTAQFRLVFKCSEPEIKTEFGNNYIADATN